MANVSYNNYNGIVQKTGNKMLSGQLYISQLALKDKLQVSLIVIGADREYNAINKSKYLNFRNRNIIQRANQYNPTVPVNMVDSTDNYDRTYNPLQQLNSVTDNRTLNNTLANLTLSYKFTENLKISTAYSEHKSVNKNSYSQINSGEVANEFNELKEKIITINLNYNKSINNHHVKILLNYSNQLNDIESSSKDSIISRQGSSGFYSTNDYKIINTSASIKYNYNYRYFLSAGISQEKSPLYRYQNSTEVFLSFKAGWSLANEQFLKNISWLKELKLYAGYGESKRQGSFETVANAISNPDIHGEKLHEVNVGLNVGLLSNRLGFSANYYNLLTNDGVELISIRPSGGYTMALTNDAEIENRGCEFSVKSQPVINPIKWTFYFGISLNKNMILSDANISGNNMKNQPAGSFYGYKFAGYSNTGDVLVFDKNGNAISYYNASYSTDRKLIGNGIPKSFFGLSNNFQYKNFDLSISIRGALGFNIENKEYYSYTENFKSILLDRNFKNYIQTVDQSALLWQNAFSLENTDYIIEKGDYVKIDNITLSYTLPSLNKPIKTIKLYLGCNNVAMFTKFRGGDPEMAGISGAYQGIYYKENYPFTRIYVLGIKCNL